MRWRAIPIALRVALVVQVIGIVAWVPTSLMTGADSQYARIHLAHAGLGFVIQVMAVAGTLELARTLAGRARVGGLIAVAGFVANLALVLVWTILSCKQSWLEHELVIRILGYAWTATELATIVGLAIASERLVLGAVSVVLGFAASPPDVLARLVLEPLHLGRHADVLVHTGMELVRTAVLIVLVAVVARTVLTTPDQGRAVSGFRRAARAMWLRVIAAAVVPAITLFVIGARAENGQRALSYALIGAAICNVWALIQFGIGVLQAGCARVPEIGRGILVAASAGALWCAGVAAAQTPEIVRPMFADDSFLRELSLPYLEAWSVVSPLIAIASIALVVGAIAGFAGRRLHHDLHTQASSRGVGFVILMFVSVAIQAWLLPTVRTPSGFVFLTLTALVCSLVATVMMATLCTRAADALDGQPGLPEAKVV
jgi:hypothetical protein